MSCPDFAKEVSYLVHAPICSPPMFLISKYHAQTTWSGQPPVARLQLVESIFFFPFLFFWKHVSYLYGWAHCCSTTLLWDPPNRARGAGGVWSFGPRGKGQLCVSNMWSPECCRGRAAAWAGDRQAAACAVQRRPRQASPSSTWTLLSQQHLRAHTPCCSLHFHQKSGVVLRAFTCDESFCKQAAAVHWNAPYTSSGWNAGWEEGREGTILSFFPNKKWYRKRIQYTVHLTNFLTNSHCNVLSRIRRNKARGRIINADCLFASYNHIIIGRSLRTFTLGRKKLKTEATSAHPWQHD